MPLVESVCHIYEPNPLACGQAVLAMLSGEAVEKVIDLVGTERETKLRDMFSALDFYRIEYVRERKEAHDKSDLPEICILSLETPKCWHWSLYFKGRFYDPEHGVLSDFPESARRYYFEIKEKSPLPKRKPNRMKGFDYSQNMAYFITICTEARKKLLCDIVGQGLAPADIRLTKFGQISEKYIKNISERYPFCEVNNYVIMPNHIHLLLFLKNAAAGASPCPTVSDIVCAFKSLTTIECRKKGLESARLFQTSFHDHIIRGEEDYRKIYSYIESNPSKWQEDEYYKTPETL